LRGVIEKVTQVPTAVSAANLGSNHSMAAIFQEFNRVAFFGFVKTGPAAVSIEFGFASKQFGTASATTKSANTIFI
jgi:hypothetical protein